MEAEERALAEAMLLTYLPQCARASPLEWIREKGGVFNV